MHLYCHGDGLCGPGCVVDVLFVRLICFPLRVVVKQPNECCVISDWQLRHGGFWTASRKILLKCAQKRCYKSILVLLYVLRCLCVEEAGSCSGRSAATLWEKLWSCVNISCLCLKSKWFQMLIQFFPCKQCAEALVRLITVCMYVGMYVCMACMQCM